MFGPSDGIAHVSYRGAGFFLPARSPGDRERVAEEVLREAGQYGAVQILLDGVRWLVHRVEARQRVACTACGESTTCICRSETRGAAAFCIRCAIGGLPSAEIYEHLLRVAS